MNTCSSCYAKFQGLGSQCLHCLTYTDLQQRKREDAQATEDTRANQWGIIRRDNLQRAQEYEEKINQDARRAVQQMRDEINQRETETKLAESQIRNRDAYEYGANYMAIDYKRGNPLVLGLILDDLLKINFTYLPPYLSAQLNNAFHRGLIDSTQKIELETSFEDIEAQYFQFGKNLTLQFQAKAIARAFGEDVFTPTENVIDRGQTVDMTNGTLVFHHDSSSISDPRLRAAWERGAASAYFGFNSQTQKKERLKKEQISRKNQIEKEPEHAATKSKFQSEALKRSNNSAKGKKFFIGLFVFSIASYFLLLYINNEFAWRVIDLQNKSSKSISINGILLKNDEKLEGGDRSYSADWYFLKMKNPMEINGSQVVECNGKFKNINIGIPGKDTFEYLRGKNITITGDVECLDGLNTITKIDYSKNDGPLMKSEIVNAAETYKNKLLLIDQEEAKRKADEKLREDFLKTPEGQQALIEEMSRPKPIDVNNLKKGIEYVYYAEYKCKMEGSRVCLTVSDYEYLCRKSKGLTRLAAGMVALSNPLAHHLLRNGNVESTKVSWIETTSLDEESRNMLRDGENLPFLRCEVWLSVSGIYKGNSVRENVYGRVSTFIVNDSNDVLVHSAM